jgi:hypothetical protein
MTETDYRAMLDAPLDSFEAAIEPPDGTYKGVVTNITIGASFVNKTPLVKVKAILKEIHEVEDMETAEKVDNLEDWSVSKDFYITKKAMVMLRRFVESALPDTAGRSTSELLPELKGAEVLITIYHSISTKDPTKSFMNVRNMVGINGTVES